MSPFSLHDVVLHLPVVTTFCAAFFCWTLFTRYREKGGGLHLLWWGIGMFTYGVGTFTEAYTTIFGWDPVVFRVWYIAGAFLGGYPLAQGSIYLLSNRRFAHASAIVASSFIVVASVCLWLSPLDPSLAEVHRLSGRVIEWRWVRLLSPFINIYSLIFLAGGAAVSAWRFRVTPELRHRYLGNILIAVGALLPGIGGSMTRAGYVEVLYVTELVGLILIYIGYRYNIAGKTSESVPLTPSIKVESSPMIRSFLPFLLAAGLALPVAAQPQDAGAAVRDSEQPAAEETVDDSADDGPHSEALRASFFATTTVTATGRELPVFEVSTPVSVLSAQEIERRMPDNPVDLLRGQPGVDVSGVGPNQARPVIRGQRGLRVLFLENGLRLNNPRRQTDFGEISGLVDMDNVERMEVVRGPASVLYGTDAIGGVLNLVTKLPSSAGGGAKVSLGLRYGSAGDQVRANAALSGRRDRLGYHLGLAYREVDAYDAPAGSFGDIRLDRDVPVTDTGVDDDSVYGVLGYGLADSQELTFRVNRYSAGRTGFGFVEPELLGDSEDFRIQIVYPYQDFERYSVAYDASALDAGWADSSRVQLYYQSNERELANDIDINIGPIFPGAPDSSVEADTLNFTSLETVGLRAEAVKVGGDRHLVTYGVEGYRDDSTNTDSSTTVTTLRFPFPPFELPLSSSDTLANAPNAANTSYGVFVQDEIAAGDRLTLTLGARYQSVSTRAEATPGWDVAGLDFDDDNIVGSANVAYAVSDNLRLVGSYGTAFRAPNIVERLFNGPTPEGAGFQILNPDLQSETSDNVEAGLKYLRSNAVFEVNLFQSDIEDGIVQFFLSPDDVAALPQDLQDEIDASGVQFVVQQRNTESLRWEGFEAVVGYRWERGLSVGGNFSHIDGKRRDSTNPPTGDTVADKLNAYLRFEPIDGRWWGEYRLRHNESQRANLDPNEPLPVIGAILPSFTIHTLAAGVRLFERGPQRHDLSLIADNLSDELYAEFSNSTFFRPQPGRTVTASYRVRF